MTRITYYHILGVSSDATDDEIAAAFRRRVKQWHPDISRHPDAEERMREINEAAEILCDPERRVRYDRALAGKAPFESATLPKQSPDAGSFFTKYGSAALFLFGFRKETLRFAATGFAALLILAGIVLAAILVFPLVAEPFSPQGGIAARDSIIPAVSPDDTLPVQQEGDERFAAGDYTGALLAYNAVIAQNPAIAKRDLWYNRGIALKTLGLYPEAAESFDRVLQISPGDSPALAQKGAALIGLSRYEESLYYTDLALSGDSNTAWIWNNRGIALIGLGQQKEARAAFENAMVFSGRPGNTLYQDVVVRQGMITRF
jgi:tetratricopeptide (TPR) repeat protein